MRTTFLVASFGFFLTAPAHSGVIGFDYLLSGGEIEAKSAFADTFPSAPIPGPIVSEYRDAGVTFFGGVTLNYEAFGGPTDTRAESGSNLESPPNLLATSDFLPLKDGTELGGAITASFEFPVSFASFSLRNGFTGASFTASIYNDGVLVDSENIVLGDFLGPDQDGKLTVSAETFDEVRIQSSQPIGEKDFGIDGFQYTPLRTSDAVHSAFELAAISAQGSEAAQDIASINFEEVWAIVADENNDGNVSNEEALLEIYEALDLIILGAEIIATGYGTLTGPIFIPCLPGFELLLNCGEVDHQQVNYSILDVFEFDVAAIFGDIDNPFEVGDEAVISFSDQGYDAIANVSVTNLLASGAEFNVRLVADVTPVPVPEPSSIWLPMAAISFLGLVRHTRRSRRKMKN
jgi:hypothetical protein